MREQASNEYGASSGKLSATLVIATKNRKNDLRVALDSAFKQTSDLEVLVIDDASSDGTSAMVATEFPNAILHRCETSHGYIAARNLGARLASGDVLFSIDDDAAFSEPDIVTRTLSDFCDSRIGAVAIPFIDINRQPDMRQKAPDEDGIWITGSFIGTAHAVRRDVFLSVGGYYAPLTHQGEEEDFCIRMLDEGYVVRLGRSAPIHHFESPKRDFSRMDYYGTRNLILFAWRNTPGPALIPHVMFTTFRALCWSLKPRRLWVRARGIVAGCFLIFTAPRRPVAAKTYQLFRSLKRGQPELLSGAAPEKEIL